jgi:hypothetical protein
VVRVGPRGTIKTLTRRLLAGSQQLLCPEAVKVTAARVIAAPSFTVELLRTRCR